jgi:hypothetical protein
MGARISICILLGAMIAAGCGIIIDARQPGGKVRTWLTSTFNPS